METETIKFEHWAIVEIFGHQQFAGLVTEQTIGGCSFVRVDVPETKERKPFTKLFGNGAIYGITIVDEKAARLKAESLKKTPMTEWEVDSLLEKAIEQRLIDAKSCSPDIDDQEFF